MTLSQTNEYEAAARARKVLALADAAWSNGLLADDVSRLSAADKAELEAQAGTRPASETTWEQVVQRLAIRESLAGTDPFEGLS